jgi:hypothetical protein
MQATLPTLFSTALQQARSDDGVVGPNDVRGLKALATKLGRPDLRALVDSLEQPLPALERRQTRAGSGYGARIVRFEPGTGDKLNLDHPEVALGRPEGAGAAQGSLHVLGLGKGGRITLELGRAATRGLVVFENPFTQNGRVANPEPGRVEVSTDGKRWVTLRGQAGLSPVFANSQNMISPRSKQAGGDRFSFADAGIAPGTEVRFVRITDLGKGFDLDAVYGY